MGDAKEIRHLVDAGMGSVSAVVATLPVGYTLGEARVVSGIKYRLMYNAGNSQIDPGYCASPATSGNGLYSVTISTASRSNHHLGACVVKHATATTATYFWGAVRGEVGVMVGDAASIPTGNAAFLGDNGKITVYPNSATTACPAIAYIKTTVSNGGVGTGNARVFFE